MPILTDLTMIASEVATEPAESVVQRLRCYFRSDHQLAQAMGSKPSTVARWLREGTSGMQQGSLTRARGVLALCFLVEPRAHDLHEIGAWIVSKQPSLDFQSPANLIVLGTDLHNALQRIAPLVAPDLDAPEVLRAIDVTLPADEHDEAARRRAWAAKLNEDPFG